ncbi:MAG: hypothetical protein ACR2H3_11180 [Acidimicrobiales bacterium]
MAGDATEAELDSVIEAAVARIIASRPSRASSPSRASVEEDGIAPKRE